MSKLQANVLLLVAAALWGFGNVAQKTVLEHLDPFSAVGLRCLIGGLLILPLAGWRSSPRSRAYCTSLLRAAAPFALGLVVQQLAFTGTSVTNASFLINTATVLTPVLAWLLLGERPTGTLALAATVTLAGVLLLSGGLGGGFGTGDLLALAAALCFALWMVELNRHLRRYGDVGVATCAQFLAAASVTLPLGAAAGTLSVPAVIAAGPELLFLGLFSTAIGFGIQTAALRFTTSSHAAVVVSAESVFGALGGALVLGERVSPAGAVGATLVLAAIMMLAQTGRDASTPAGNGLRAVAA